MAKSLLKPDNLSIPVRRIVGNELLQALRSGRWVRHSRLLANNTANFRIIGAHTSTRRRSEVEEEIERYISVVIMPDARISMPMLAVLLSGTAYEQAEKEAGSDFMSLTHFLKTRAATPYRIDKNNDAYRVRKVPQSGATTIALEALDTLVRHCVIVDVTPALATAFEDALAEAPGAHDVVTGAAILREQLGIGA